MKDDGMQCPLPPVEPALGGEMVSPPELLRAVVDVLSGGEEEVGDCGSEITCWSAALYLACVNGSLTSPSTV